MQVSGIEDKLMDIRLRWFGHGPSRPTDVPVRMCETMVNEDVERGR